MPSPGKVEATQRSLVFQGLGSFWTSVFRDKAQVRRLLDLVWQTSTLADFNASTGKRAGDYQLSRIRSGLITFNREDIISAGQVEYDSATVGTYGSPADYRQIFDGARNWHGVPWREVMPLAIQGRSGRLGVGQDFWVHPGGWVFFRDDPAVEFPDGVIAILEGLAPTGTTAAAWLAEADGRDQQALVTRYLRGQQTPGAFRLALATVAGLAVLETRQRLLAVFPAGRGYRYVFDQEGLLADYPHTPLTPDADYAAGTIIGDGVQVLHDDGTARAWWRSVDWRGGLSLDPFLAVRGLRALDRDVTAYSAGADAGSLGGSRLHARVQLSDDFWLEHGYWNGVAARETSDRQYLNQVVRLPEDPTTGAQVGSLQALLLAAADAEHTSRVLNLPLEQPNVDALHNTRLINAIDMLFQSVFARRGLVVVLHQGKVPRPAAALQFIRENLPAGCAPIVLSHPADLPVERITIGANLGLTESVIIGVLVPRAATEQVLLGNMTVERVEIRHLVPVA